MSRSTKRSLGALVGIGAIGLYWAVANGLELPSAGDLLEHDAPPAATGPSAVSAMDVADAAEQLEALRVADLGDGAGYDRDAFGQRWADIDRNGCDQRNDALRAAGRDVQTKPGTHDCVVLQATIDDPYTGSEITFVKGENTVDIDHVVPLSRAWRQGAADWPAERREEFANTADNLVAVDASANRSKGDDGPEEWMPDADRCSYAVRWVEVKTQFELSVAPREKQALTDELATCEGNL